MEEIFPGVETWSWYSEEKGIDFNGHLITKGRDRVLIDPPPMSIDDKQDLSIGGVTVIILTNRDHIREAMEYRVLLNTKIWVPEADASQMGSIAIDRTFKDGELLPGGLKVVSIPNGKSPGESALYSEQQGGMFILGDALIGKPPGSLSFLPADRFSDMEKAREGVRRLLSYPFNVVLVGDGKSILSEGKKAVEMCLADHP